MAFARLVGRNGPEEDFKEVLFLVDRTPLTLGRMNSDTCVSINSADTTLSRHHAELSWNASEGVFQIKCLSKNGMVVDRRKVASGQIATLKQHSAIRLGASRLYFQLPIS